MKLLMIKNIFKKRPNQVKLVAEEYGIKKIDRWNVS